VHDQKNSLCFSKKKCQNLSLVYHSILEGEVGSRENRKEIS